MRLDSVRFGVRTNKTIRKAEGTTKGTFLSQAQQLAIKKSNEELKSKVAVYKNKMIKSENYYEKINKKEQRKRKLREDEVETYGIEEEELDTIQEKEIMFRVVPDLEEIHTQEESDTEDQTEVDQETASEESQADINDVEALLQQLKTLQNQSKDFSNLTEEEQMKIHHLQRDLQKHNPKFVEVEGNFNRQTRPFTLQKLSGFMDSSELMRKFLQTGEKQGKYLLKPQKKGPSYVHRDGKNKQHKKKVQRSSDVKNDLKVIKEEK